MDYIELEARRARGRPYDVVPQEDRGRLTPLASNDGYAASDTKAQIGEYDNSISRSMLAEAQPQESTFRLPPKSYSLTPRNKRVWKHIAIGSAALILVVVPIAILIPILYANDASLFAPQGFTYCDLYGQSAMTTSEDSFSTIFNVDVAFGNLSFGTAKIIDLIWDVGFSRCGQAMLGWITYQINTAVLLRIMETHPVSYDFYLSLSFSWSSFASLVPVTRALFTKLGFRKRLLVLWLLLSIIWVAAWPTITNAMTGYVAENHTLVKLIDEDGYVPLKDLEDSDNLAFQFYSAATGAYNYSQPPQVPIGPILTNSGPNITLWQQLYDLVQASHDAIYTIATYNTSIENGATIDTPASIFYYYRNQTYAQSYFEEPDNVQCVAIGVYQWGFSITSTLIFTVINGVWLIGAYGVWMHMNRKSELCRKGRRLGKYRAALDLVESINYDLGRNTCAYSEKELAKELENMEGIQYYVRHGDGDTPSHIGISSGREHGPVVLRFGELYGRTNTSAL